jgi:hypothetical protein
LGSQHNAVVLRICAQDARRAKKWLIAAIHTWNALGARIASHWSQSHQVQLKKLLFGILPSQQHSRVSRRRDLLRLGAAKKAQRWTFTESRECWASGAGKCAEHQPRDAAFACNIIKLKTRLNFIYLSGCKRLHKMTCQQCNKWCTRAANYVRLENASAFCILFAIKLTMNMIHFMHRLIGKKPNQNQVKFLYTCACI